MSKFTTKDALSIWWAFTWRAMACSLITAIVIGFLLGVILSIVGLGKHAGVAAGILGAIVGTLFSVIMFKKALNKEYKNFSLEIKRIKA